MILRENDRPIGIFDSGLGGLTVLKEIQKLLPDEDLIYFGDNGRTPYGTKSKETVIRYTFQDVAFLLSHHVKMIVIACNTATAAGLSLAQTKFPVPVIGVVEPGARAAARATRNKRVGVIATKGTVESDVYTHAIRANDAGITVFATAAPRFVEIAELGIQMAKGPIENYTSLASQVYIRPEFQEIAQDYLDPLRRCDVDTLVLGCTHFPLLKSLIGGVMGREVVLISSASEVARDCADILSRQGIAAQPDNEARYEFFTSGDDIEAFRRFGTRVLRFPLDHLTHIVL